MCVCNSSAILYTKTKSTKGGEGEGGGGGGGRQPEVAEGARIVKSEVRKN